MHLSHDKDYASSIKGNGYSLNAYYQIAKKFELGVEGSMYKDKSSGKTYDGHGYMIGAQYLAAKGVAFFVGTQFTNWDDGARASSKIDGNGTGFIGKFSKSDDRRYTFGANFAF